MSYRSTLVLIPALSFVLSVSAMADLTMTNGADINMNGSTGSTIIFPDGTVLSTASGTGADGADGATGPAGPQGPAGTDGADGSDGAAGADGTDGSDAAVPAGHGGTGNTVSGPDSFVGGGYGNTASNYYATVAGGYANTADENSATVGGGFNNTASEWYSTIGGGDANTADGDSATVAGGSSNTASGSRSTVGGGDVNTASGEASFAAGRLADASHDNSFVWGDAGGGGSAADNTFNVHASGGIYLNGVSQHASDRNKKEAFEELDPVAVLSKVAELPITSWRFKTEDESVRHIGPMAQDFMETFGYGTDDRYIAAVDVDGIALAAIQGLNKKLEERDQVIATHSKKLEERDQVIAAQDKKLSDLEGRLAAIETALAR